MVTSTHKALIADQTIQKLNSLILKRRLRNVSTFKFFSLTSHYEILLNVLFDAKTLKVSNLYLDTEDDVIDDESLRNDFDVVLQDLQISLNTKV